MTKFMPKIKTPYDFSLGGEDKDYAVKAYKCSNDVEKVIYWFNEYIDIILDEIVEDDGTMCEQEWKLTTHSIPENLYQLVAHTWLKFDYFCHTKKKDDLPEGINNPDIGFGVEDSEVICTNTDLKEENYNKYCKGYFEEVLEYVKQTNYLAACFAQAGWDLRTEQLSGCKMRYILSWRTPDEAADRVKMLPKRLDNYTKATMISVFDSKVKNKIGFDREKLTDWFNTELEKFYNDLTNIETLKYAVSKEFFVDYHDIPKEYYKIVSGKPYSTSKYILLTKPFVDILEENHWYIDSHSKDISGQFPEPDLIKFVYGEPS